MKQEVVIAGGGLAGLTCALALARRGVGVCVLERSSYPRHKVCGEYVSLEVRPLLESLDAFPEKEQPVLIDRLLLTTQSGFALRSSLPLGAFIISRYTLDHFLYQKVREAGGEVRTNTLVTDVRAGSDKYMICTRAGETLEAPHFISCHGKHANLDKRLDRPFRQKPAPWIGVKYHMEWNMPEEEVQLHHFPMGYCGVSRVEQGRVNVCYLVHARQLRQAGSIDRLEREVLSRNDHLARLFAQAGRLWEQPLTISNISFAARAPEQNGLLFAGDAAGLISPLCGNGMAMAIQSGYQLALLSQAFLRGNLTRADLNGRYRSWWQAEFGRRLWWGRQLQKLFWRPRLMDGLVGLGARMPTLTQKVISFTHGKPLPPASSSYV